MTEPSPEPPDVHLAAHASRSASRLGASLGRTFNPLEWRRRGAIAGTASALVALVIVIAVLGFWWSLEPDPFGVEQRAQAMAEANGQEIGTGYVTTATLIGVTDTLLHKPGGYLDERRAAPGVLMDNMPAWEFGVVVQVRDLARVLRNEISRSQTQSREDEDLAHAEPQFNFDANSWLFPSTEGEYEEGLGRLRDYRDRLAAGDADFYARADNLNAWLAVVGQRLGGIAQRLGASVGEWRVNTDLAGDRAATQAQQHPAREVRAQTPWLEIDNEFYHARGATWALLHFLQATRVDFESVLADKNAEASMAQVIRALEATQRPMGSPIVLNGDGFGFFANHSLVMASYISRANAGIIDLRRLLEQG
ncbi:MAG: DUF2333 family protein [Halofilum sp. (in: g-proteobacteria)]|nr:DUF2333 family protein [Halofilum sp. (in: g-proteobacteria)]